MRKPEHRRIFVNTSDIYQIQPLLTNLICLDAGGMLPIRPRSVLGPAQTIFL